MTAPVDALIVACEEPQCLARDGLRCLDGFVYAPGPHPSRIEAARKLGAVRAGLRDLPTIKGPAMAPGATGPVDSGWQVAEFKSRTEHARTFGIFTFTVVVFHGMGIDPFVAWRVNADGPKILCGDPVEVANAIDVPAMTADAIRACEDAARAAGIAVPDATPRKPLLYMAHPVAPTAEQMATIGLVDHWLAREKLIADVIESNLRRARRWLRWFSVRAPTVVVIAPWIAAVQSVLEAGVEEREERAREMVVCRDVASRCDAVAKVGGRVSGGMDEEGRAARRVVDLTAFGEEPPTDDAAVRAILALVEMMREGR